MQAGPALKPGTRIRVTQTIRSRDDEWTAEVEGEVLSHRPEKTESWFAHGKYGKVWLNRIRLKKDDGEITTLNLDAETRVTVLQVPES